MYTLITNCSHTRTVEPKVKVGEMPTNQTMQSAADWWVNELNSHTADITPRELYRGIGFSTVAKIEEQFKPDTIKIVTGGQGFIDIDEQIVSYDFTAAKNEPHNIWNAVTAEPFVQSVWWRKINQMRFGKPLPIAAYVNDCDDELVLVSCGKVFVRYIAEDLLSISKEGLSKLRILLAASSVGSVPAQLRPYIIPFDRDVIAHLPGNRNDGNHRAALLFLTYWHEDPEFRNASIEAQRTRFISGTSSTSTRTQLDLDALFKSRPELLAMDVDRAYSVVRREFGTFGGKMYFRSAWRLANNHSIEVDESAVPGAAASMAGLTFMQPSNASAHSQGHEEDEILVHLRLFGQALKTVAPYAVFNAANISQWAESHYGESVLPALKQPNKLAYIIKNNADLLGFIEVDSGGAKAYKLNLDTPTPAQEVIGA